MTKITPRFLQGSAVTQDVSDGLFTHLLFRVSCSMSAKNCENRLTYFIVISEDKVVPFRTPCIKVMGQLDHVHNYNTVFWSFGVPS